MHCGSLQHSQTCVNLSWVAVVAEVHMRRHHTMQTHSRGALAVCFLGAFSIIVILFMWIFCRLFLFRDEEILGLLKD